jgi:hypothetical protein
LLGGVAARRDPLGQARRLVVRARPLAAGAVLPVTAGLARAVEAERAVPLDLAELADGQVHRDAEQPGVRRRVATEAAEFFEPARERLLGQLAGFLAVADHPQHGVEQPVLVADDELPVRRAVAAAGVANQIQVGRGRDVCSHGLCPRRRRLLGTTAGAARRPREVGLVLCAAQARHGVGRGIAGEVPSRAGHPCPARETGHYDKAAGASQRYRTRPKTPHARA